MIAVTTYTMPNGYTKLKEEYDRLGTEMYIRDVKEQEREKEAPLWFIGTLLVGFFLGLFLG